MDEGSQQYPYPSHVNTGSFLSIKLSGKPNYMQWQEQMLCLVDSHDMLGFIDGTLKKPKENNASKTKANMPAFAAKYREWKRSDTLVKGWIFGSLSEDVMGTVVGLQTARDVWNKLKVNYRTLPVSASIVAKSTKDVEEYMPLYRAIQVGDWETTLDFFNNKKSALTDKLNVYGHRAIHIAIGNPENTSFLEKLLEKITPELLPTLVNDRKQNAMHYAAGLDNYVAAKMLVAKNPVLLFMVSKNKHLPIQQAVHHSHKTTFRYLLEMCKHYIQFSEKEGCHSPFKGEKGVRLLNDTILAGFLDDAYNLLQDYPELARTTVANLKVPLWCIANKRDAYPSAKQYNFYQRFVYSYVPTEKRLNHANKNADIENQETHRANPVTKCTKSYAYSVMKRLLSNFGKLHYYMLSAVPHIKCLQKDKVEHNTTLMILKFITQEVCTSNCNHFEHCYEAFITALKNDTPEVIKQITTTFPHSVWYRTIDGYTLPQVSIMNRCENIYNFFVHEVTHNKCFHTLIVDQDENNLLHLAGQLAPTHKLNMVTGAALQMQMELQWFQDVGKLVRPKEREAVNKNKETPLMVFRREHKYLRKEGEVWLKKTADSYTITAALIITIVFAAAITVPGGNKEDTGYPTFATKLGFKISIVSDAISLFTSTTALLLFLSILTAHYAEEDFLYKLPKRLILGLVMLFMSVTTMLIAFSATLYIMLGQDKSWILIIIATITCLPIASFMTLQLPLLVDLISSTYGRGIFGKRSDLRIA
ncbi:putative ankyrin repeat-containing domain, PGG domain, retrotransposon Copia-like protein [Helianthus annuus]|uniref:Ankyrin repeat-containing domain, PGG domain, retrotransposon Copia-like protein n=3 Tax=Helianthus annuus TaxID=4232 RepID=A0A251RYQ9_HELAN|nr:uncharacterized protein LOC110915737 isoform X1 [Helianthus annuus]KAF5760052.1 putative ankyrin repeat-containing domain, PGG domain, retrotransposon Copia-like protein [Helianthus annuus]KAJ0460485.1 putative PGG domain, retrotransposon Copia-like, ankyrin repeat-containing domain superfamily [Helianthus annuus]